MRNLIVRSSRAVHEHRYLIGREIAIGIAFIGAAVLMTWPLAMHLSTAVLGPSDPYVSTSILDWDLYALTHHPLALFDLPVFFPARDALAFTEHLFGIALVVLPFRLLGASPIALHSIAMILGFAFCGYAAAVLGAMITRSTAAGLVGGLCYAFVPYRFHHLTHVSYVWSGWLPLLLASLLWYAKRPSWRRAVAFGTVFFLNGITCLHWLAFGSVAIVLTAVFLAADGERFFDARWWIRLGIAMTIASAALLPWIIPYQKVAREYGMQRSWVETKPYSARWSDWLMAPRENRLFGQLVPEEAYEGEHPLFPGVVVLLLAGAALVLVSRNDFPREPHADRGDRRRAGRGLHLMDAAIVGSLAIALFTTMGARFDWRIGSLKIMSTDSSAIPLTIACALLVVRLWIRFPQQFRERSLRDGLRHSRFPTAAWCALLWIALGVIGSFGLDGFFHQTLFRLLPPMRGIRVPLRWAMIAYVGLSAIAAVGMLPLLRTSSRLRRGGATAAVALAILFECHAAPIHWFMAPDRLPPVYRWLSGVAFDGGILELPISERFSDYEYLRAQTIHHHPLVNGVSSFVPARYDRLTALAHSDPIDAGFIGSLETLGCSLVVVHVDDLYERRPAIRTWLKSELNSGRLAFVRRFDHKLFGDYVFAITRNCKEAGRWRAPERVDASGRTPSQTLGAFLDADAFTFNEETSGALGSPAWGQDVRGALTVFGWALSPHGVKAVNLLFDDGRVRVPASLSDAPPVTRRQPWYPQTTHPGFSAIVPVLPHLDRTTDLQVEIVDGRGAITRLEDIPFRWSDKRGLKEIDWNAQAVDGLLGRMGMDSAVARPALLRRNMTAADIGNRIVAESKERSNQEFIERLYAVLLERPADPFAFQRWTEKLAHGVWRRDVVDALLTSDEFARKYLLRGATMEPLR
jgi:Domain of unknown function (DUF4214)